MSTTNLLLTGGLALLSLASTQLPGAETSATSLQLPVLFEPNAGQWPSDVAFAGRGGGLTLNLLRDGVAIGFDGPKAAHLRMRFTGANRRAAWSLEQPSGAATNYLVGQDRGSWRTGVRQFAEARLANLYPGIDLVFHAAAQGANQQLEYDFLVHPGADPRAIRYRVEGASVRLTPEGDLELSAGGHRLLHRKPSIYQHHQGATTSVDGAFTLQGAEVAFHVGPYDPARDLVIDPVLFSNVLPGSFSYLSDTVADPAGNIYAVGFGDSTVAATNGAAQTKFGGGTADAIVVKYSSAGTLLWLTYLGGSNDDYGSNLMLDAGGNLIVTGNTSSSNFPAAGTPIQARNGGASDIFIARISPDGSKLLYSTYYGGVDDEMVGATKLDSKGNILIAGSSATENLQFPGKPAQSSFRGSPTDVLILKLNPDATMLLNGTYLGGDSYDQANALALDANDNVYIGGWTFSKNLQVTPGAAQTTNSGSTDAFAARLDPALSTVAFLTYLGGSESENINGLAVAPDGSALWVTGTTGSANYPVLPNALQPKSGGGFDAFLAKFSGSGALLASTYLGGAGEDSGDDILLGKDGTPTFIGVLTTHAYDSGTPTPLGKGTPVRDALANTETVFATLDSNLSKVTLLINVLTNNYAYLGSNHCAGTQVLVCAGAVFPTNINENHKGAITVISLAATPTPTSLTISQSLSSAGVIIPQKIEFKALANGPPPPPQVVQAAADAPGVTIDASITGANWLTAVPNSGASPFATELVANPTGLFPGTYTTEVVFSVAGFHNLTSRLSVSLMVDPAGPPHLDATPTSVHTSVPLNAAPVTRNVTLFNRGSAPANFKATIEGLFSGTPFVTVSPATGAIQPGAPATLRLDFTPGNKAGIGSANLRVENTTTGEIINVPLALAIAQSATLRLSQTALALRAVDKGPSPRPESVLVQAEGGGLSWTTSVQIDSGLPAWLTAQGSGSSSPGVPGNLQITVDSSRLDPGNYYGQVTLTADGAANSPVVLPLVLTVQPQSTPIDLTVTPAGLLFTKPTPQTIEVYNPSPNPATINFQLQSSAVFTATGPASLTLAPGNSLQLTVTPKAGASVGVHRETLSIQASGNNRVFAVDLVYIVPAQAGAMLSRAASESTPAPRTVAAVCPPGGLEMVTARQSLGFRAVTGLPVPIEVRVADLNAQPLTAGAVSASLSGGSGAGISLVPITSDPGRWSGTLQAPAQTSGPITLRLDAGDAGGARTGCLEITGSVEDNGGPVIGEGGVVSTASFAGGAPLAPGGIVAIFGSNLATGSNAATTLPLPNILGDTRVSIAGRNVPLFYAGDNGSYSQVNGALPFNLTPNVGQQLILRRGGLFSVAELLIAPAEPAVFQLPGGQGIIVRGDNALVLADAAHPVTAGDAIVIFAEGLGEVSETVQTGSASPVSPLAKANSEVTATVGGVPAQVFFAGLTPGLANLYQINVLIPSAVAAGDAVPVIVTAGGVPSIAVTIGVK